MAPKCEFNHKDSFQVFENAEPCNLPARILLVVVTPDGKHLKELTCQRADHYLLASDWMACQGDLTEYTIREVSGVGNLVGLSSKTDGSN